MFSLARALVIMFFMMPVACCMHQFQPDVGSPKSFMGSLHKAFDLSTQSIYGLDECAIAWVAEKSQEMFYPAVYYHTRYIVQKWRSDGFPYNVQQHVETALLRYLTLVVHDLYLALLFFADQEDIRDRAIGLYERALREITTYWFGGFENRRQYLAPTDFCLVEHEGDFDLAEDASMPMSSVQKGLSVAEQQEVMHDCLLYLFDNCFDRCGNDPFCFWPCISSVSRQILDLQWDDAYLDNNELEISLATMQELYTFLKSMLSNISLHDVLSGEKPLASRHRLGHFYEHVRQWREIHEDALRQEREAEEAAYLQQQAQEAGALSMTTFSGCSAPEDLSIFFRSDNAHYQASRIDEWDVAVPEPQQPTEEGELQGNEQGRQSRTVARAVGELATGAASKTAEAAWQWGVKPAGIMCAKGLWRFVVRPGIEYVGKRLDEADRRADARARELQRSQPQ